MIKNWLITGDTHGRVMERLSHITEYNPQETALIILGDAGINFYLNNTDIKNKIAICNSGFIIYVVRGNHEERPENLGYPIIYDANVDGKVYREETFPNINYFLDGQEYNIQGHSVLVIGGAYSVDKYYRLSKFPDKTKWTGWFKDEQLTPQEMENIEKMVVGKKYDIILTHTAPIAWEPTDLFLSGIKQFTIDKTMELWLDKLKNKIDWKIWLFGHYHTDRLERPRVEMFYTDIEELSTVWRRWNSNEPLLDWWLEKSPNYYMN